MPPRIALALTLVASVGIGVLPAAGQGREPGSGTPGQVSPGPEIDRPARDTPAQRRPTEELPTAVITGRVISTDGTPLARARVMARSDELRVGRIARTDESGRYEIRDLQAGRYTVTATRSGFITLSYGQRRPRERGTPIELATGSRLSRIDFALPPGSVITGRVLDETGEPLVGATVTALQYTYRRGSRTLTSEGGDRTDDRGVYRIFGLMPGEYYLRAEVEERGGWGRRGFDIEEQEEPSTFDYAPGYYPGGSTPSSSGQLHLEVGQELTNIDFAVQLVASVKVEGFVNGPDGRPADNARLALVNDDGTGFQNGTRTRIAPDGSFSLSRVVPGRYRLVASGRATGSSDRLSAMQPLTVGGTDLDNLVVRLSRGPDITGQVVVEGSTPLPPEDLTDLRIQVIGTGDTGFGRDADEEPEIDGTFTIEGVPPGPLVVAVDRLPTGWGLARVELGGRDVTDLPIDYWALGDVPPVTVRLTDRLTRLTGAIRDAMGRPLTDFTVVVFPRSEALWNPLSRRIDARRPDLDGTYTFEGLPDGDYLLAVTDFVETGAWTDEGFLRRIRPTAVPITLGPGELRTQDVTVAMPAR